jgi:hypothetical protein
MRTGLGKSGDPSEQTRKSYNTVGKTHRRCRTCGDYPPETTRFHNQPTWNIMCTTVSDCSTEHLKEAKVEVQVQCRGDCFLSLDHNLNLPAGASEGG